MTTRLVLIFGALGSLSFALTLLAGPETKVTEFVADAANAVHATDLVLA